MTFRNHTATAALLATLTACSMQPAHADAFPDSLPSDPARPGWYPPAARPYVPMAGNHYDFDPDTGPLANPSIEDPYWPSPINTWGWGAGASAYPIPLPAPDVVTRNPCRPPAAVPGPLPLAGVAAAFGWARRLRKRVGK